MSRQVEVREKGRTVGTAKLVDGVGGHTKMTFPHIAVIELDDGHKESDLVISREEISRIDGDIYRVAYMEVWDSSLRPLRVFVVPSKH